MILSSYTNLNCIRININFFVQDDEYFEYLLKDLNYLGEKMFIIWDGLITWHKPPRLLL
jgi:hypothetical protein